MGLKGTIISIKPNASVPDAFFEKVLEANQSFGGFAAAIDQEGVPTLAVLLQEGPSSLEDIKDVLLEHAAYNCFWHFGSVEGAFSQKDIQPLTLIEDDAGVPQVIGFFEGNFEDKGGEAETATKLIIPFLKRIWKGCDDVTEFMNDLSTDPSVADQMNLYYQGRATITIVGANGESISFGDNALRTEYEWGWTSNPCGYAEAVAAPVAAPVKSGFGKRATPVAAVTPAKPVTATPTAAKPTAVVATAKPDVASKEEMWGPPVTCVSKNQIKEWYVKNNGGVIPEGYKHRPLVPKTDGPIKSFAELKDKPIANVTPIKQAVIQKSETVVPGKQVSGEVLPVAPPKQKEWLKSTFLKRGSVQRTVSDGQAIIDPKRMEAMEEKFSTYAEMAGLEDLRDTYHYTPEDWLVLAKEAPESAMILMMNLTYALAKVWPQEAVQKQVEEQPVVQPAKKFGGSRKVS